MLERVDDGESATLSTVVITPELGRVDDGGVEALSVFLCRIV